MESERGLLALILLVCQPLFADSGPTVPIHLPILGGQVDISVVTIQRNHGVKTMAAGGPRLSVVRGLRRKSALVPCAR